MRLDGIKTRLVNLEKKRSTSDALLTFADGSTRSLFVKDPLGCCCAAFNRIHWKTKAHHGMPPRTKGPFPVSPHDNVLDLMSNAVEIESNDVFLELVWECAVQGKR
jgi:hypothetical protein